MHYWGKGRGFRKYFSSKLRNMLLKIRLEYWITTTSNHKHLMENEKKKSSRTKTVNMNNLTGVYSMNNTLHFRNISLLFLRKNYFITKKSCRIYIFVFYRSITHLSNKLCPLLYFHCLFVLFINLIKNSGSIKTMVKIKFFFFP